MNFTIPSPPGTEEIEVPEIPVRHWPSSLPFEQMGNAGKIAMLATQGTEIDPHAVLFSLLTVTGGRHRRGRPFVRRGG